MSDLSSGTHLLFSAMSMALSPMIIMLIGVGLGLFFLVSMSKQEPYPGFRKSVLWFTGIMLAAVGAMALMPNLGQLRWFRVCGQPSTWAVLLLVAIGVLAIGALIRMLSDPKTRHWGFVLLSVLVAGALVTFLMVWVGVDSYTTHTTWRDVPARPMEVPRNVARHDQPDRARYSEEFTSPTERRPGRDPAKTANEPQPEPRPSGSGTSENTSKKEPKKPLPDGRGSEDRGSDKDESETNNKRPDWVDDPPHKIAIAYCPDSPPKIDNTYHHVLVVGPYSTRLECDNKMDKALRRAVKEYIDLYLEDNPKYRWRISLPDDYIQKKIVKKTWEERKETSVGPMTQVHVLLAFDQKTNSRIKKQLNELWYHRRGRQRMALTVVALGSVLAVLLIAYLVLKFNVAPKLILYRWHALQALIIGALIMMALVAIFLCMYVDDNLQKYSIPNTIALERAGPEQSAHDAAQRSYVQLATGLWLVLPLTGATMLFLAIKKKTRVIGFAGILLVLLVTLGAFLTLAIS